MARQLQNGIFGIQRTPVTEDNLNALPLHQWKGEGGAETAKNISLNTSSTNSELTQIKLELLNLKKHLQEVESRAQRAESKSADAIEQCKKLIEKTLLVAKGNEEKLKSSLQDLVTEISVIKGRLKENRLSEAKVEEMLQRHNRVVQMFEQRMDQLQKFIKDQDLRLLSYRSLLSEFQAKLSEFSIKR